MSEWNSTDAADAIRADQQHDLSWGYATGWFGPLVIAWIDTAICWVEPDPRSDCIARIEAHWDSISMCRDDLQAQRCCAAICDVAHPAPLRLRGTPYQIRIWQELLAIPFGQTVSYADLAEQAGVGRQSARAVGSAVGANHVALAVPCHRVLPAGGGLGGFRWGAKLKQAFLTREQSMAASLSGRAA
jgi:AraC family transcriptional regulator of adaptative response/methylated-DNA-[protein]-cysteine methyltransferase